MFTCFRNLFSFRLIYLTLNIADNCSFFSDECAGHIPPDASQFMGKINWQLVTCQVPPGFSTKNGQVHIRFSTVNDWVWFLASSLCCFLRWHNYLRMKDLKLLAISQINKGTLWGRKVIVGYHLCWIWSPLWAIFF